MKIPSKTEGKPPRKRRKKRALPLHDTRCVKSMRPRPAGIPATAKRSAVGYRSQKRLGEGSDLTNNGDEIKGLFQSAPSNERSPLKSLRRIAAETLG